MQHNEKTEVWTYMMNLKNASEHTVFKPGAPATGRHRPARTWFFSIASVLKRQYVCVCVRPRGYK